MRHRRTKAELFEASQHPENRWCSACQAYRPTVEFSPSQRLCRTHHAAYMRGYRKIHSETERYRTDPVYAEKVRTRKRLAMRRRRSKQKEHAAS